MSAQLPNAVLMLGHRLRRWTNIKTALGNHTTRGGGESCYIKCSSPSHYKDVTQVSFHLYKDVTGKVNASPGRVVGLAREQGQKLCGYTSGSIRNTSRPGFV